MNIGPAIAPPAVSQTEIPDPATREPPPADDEKVIGVVDTTDPLEFLESVMRNPLAEDSLRVRAAVTIASYRHAKKGDAGKKEQKANAAKKASSGRFAPAAPPKGK